MSKSMIVSFEGKPCYDIFLEPDFSKLADCLKRAGYAFERKICIVTDSNLAGLHLKALSDAMKSCFTTVISFCFPAGEESKNLNTVQNLYQKLIENRFDRRDLLVAFGGGVVGDLTGFTAATYLRGIDFIQIPTTLLSQVDSSIGGKTGVDFLRYKNMVGAFYQPKLVYMNLSLLHTLPGEQFASGMGEVIKHGLIQSRNYFFWLKENERKILTLQPEIIEEMIYESCQIKRNIVECDPTEKGVRALLNFGHTIGHAVEKLSDFSLFHGECVAVGIAAACRISCDLGYMKKQECQEVTETLKKFHLPVLASHMTAEEILAASKSDKKMAAGKIRFILLKSIGSAEICPDLSDEQILAGITSVLEE